MRILSRKKVLASLATAIVLYFLVRCRQHSFKFSATIPHVRPLELWEFVSDFSNMKKLNPTITDFVIETESGNYDHWKYRVYYTEHLSQLPSLKNFAWADFEIKILSKNTYAIYSTHKTCFLTSLTCVNTKSSFIVQSTSNPSETMYTELIQYECPAIFSFFCENEVKYQREKIRDNLLNIFKEITDDTEPKAFG